MQTIIQQILGADRLDSIAQAHQAMDVYTASHPETTDPAHPIWGAAGAMKRTEDALRDMEKDGVDLGAFYQERDNQLKELLQT